MQYRGCVKNVKILFLVDVDENGKGGDTTGGRNSPGFILSSLPIHY